MSAPDRTGWYEFIKPGAATTHIGYAQENGSVYLPEGPEVVSEEDFRLASATSDRFWRLVREPRTITTEEDRAQLPNMSVVRSDAGSIANVVDGKAYFFGFEHGVDAKMLALPITILWEVTQ